MRDITSKKNGPEGLGRKTLKFGLNEYSIQNEKLT